MIEWYGDEIWIPVERLAVSECELGSFYQQVNEVRVLGVIFRQIELVEQGEVLQGDRALAPGSGLAQRVVVIIVGDWIFDRGMPGRQIVSAKQAGMTTPAGVEDRGLSAEQIDRLGNKTPVPAFPGRLDLVFPGSAGVLRVTDQSTVCCGQLAVAK